MRKFIVFVLLMAGLIAFAISTGLADRAIAWRVKSGLIEAGISEKRADCMAPRMVKRLSILQLRKLQNMEALPGEADSPTGLGDFIKRVRRVGDAEVITVTGSSAALCAAGIG